ncbi:serine/threonine-protein kinase [Streptomyces sp. NPDC048172]|uniref:serine/threonine-protein kinase n=1 Tax=Streptomyces sp. NPDC048172 TaxID=3365505 RepID=UPI003717D1A2
MTNRDEAHEDHEAHEDYEDHGGNGDGQGDGEGDSDGLQDLGGVQPLWPGDPRRIGPYPLLGRLGSGGMGRVYLARSEGGRTVAVKAVHEEHLAKTKFRARFRREIEAARRVGGRWTAPVLDADPDAEQPWVATGYVPGPGLDAVVKQYGPLPAHSVRALADGLLRALRGIHAAGIVHRDLKPSNVLLTVEGPRVIDFGIAYALEPSDEGPLTSTGTAVGSPGFMAPEQILGEEPGPAADVFALGGVLVYAATGRLPFGHGASNQHAVLYKIVESDPDLSTVEDAALRTLIGRCLTKESDERPGVDELLDDLAATTDTEAEEAGPWLPPRLVAHLAQQTARLLDVEAMPVGAGPAAMAAAGSTGASANASEDGNTGGNKDGSTATARTTGPRLTARRWAVVGAVVAVVAAGGTLALLDRDGDARADSRGRHSAAPGSDASPAAPDHPGAKDADGKKDGKGKDEGKGRDAGSADDGAASGDAKGGKGGERGADGKDGKDGKDASGGKGDGGGDGDGGKGSGSGDTGGGDGGSGGGSSGGGSGGGGDAPSGNRVPQRFVGTWKLGTGFGGPRPTEIRIYKAAPGQLAARLISDNGQPSLSCEATATLTGTADGGKRLNIGTTKLTGSSTPGFCQKDDPSYFTLDSASVLRHHPASYTAGYTYKKG